MANKWATLILAVTTCSLIGSPLAAQTASLPHSCPVVTSGPDVDTVRQLEERGAAVNVSGWTVEEARAFFAPEWVSLQPDGSVTKVDAVLARFQNGRSVAWAQSFELNELDVRVFCDTAVVVGLARARPLGASGTKVINLRYANIWRKRNGRWLYTANQFDRF